MAELSCRRSGFYPWPGKWRLPSNLGPKSSRLAIVTGSALRPFLTHRRRIQPCQSFRIRTSPIRQGDLTPPAARDRAAPATLEAQTAVTDIPWLQASVYALVAALVAGFLAWDIGEKTFGYYQPSPQAKAARDFTALNREKRIAVQKNTAIAYGTFGALLGLLSGAAGGALRRSIPGGASAALAGLLLGGIGGALVSYELAPIFARFSSDEAPSLLLSFLVRGGIWGVVGMTAGLALGWGWRGLPAYRGR